MTLPVLAFTKDLYKRWFGFINKKSSSDIQKPRGSFTLMFVMQSQKTSKRIETYDSSLYFRFSFWEIPGSGIA